MTGTRKTNDARRVSAFVDGFNLFHAIDDIGREHLKWLDLFALVRQFCDPTVHSIKDIWYFSAYATWRPAHVRHIQYVKALELSGVRCVMGNFKDKTKHCPQCAHEWIGHEEKESDVNLAIHLIHQAQLDSFDEAFVISRDSDIAPAVKLLRQSFPHKLIKLLSPPERRHSKELASVSHKLAKIRQLHLERALFPAKIEDQDGKVLVTRPSKYDPPIPAQ